VVALWLTHEINPLLCRPGGRRFRCHGLQQWRVRDIGRLRAGQVEPAADCRCLGQRSPPRPSLDRPRRRCECEGQHGPERVLDLDKRGIPGAADLTLEHGADVDSKDSFNGTGLIRAADRGHADIAGRLVQAKIEIDHINNLGWTALHEAIILGDGSRRYVETVRVLVAAGADLRLQSQRDQITPLAHATAKGHSEIAEVLNAALNADRPSRRVVNRRLLAAAERGDATAAALAIRGGANPETRDEKGRTPLLLAVTKDRVAVARLLVYLGADPTLDDRHDTPWLVTGVTGSVDMLDVLLPAQPDLTIRNRFGGTSLIPASERGHVDYVRRVVRTDIDVNHVNDLGWTALLEAVILGDGSKRYQQIVTILLSAGADPRIADRGGVTALQHATRRGHDEVARILRNA
jgi:uncharacterized protein